MVNIIGEVQKMERETIIQTIIVIGSIAMVINVGFYVWSILYEKYRNKK